MSITLKQILSKKDIIKKLAEAWGFNPDTIIIYPDQNRSSERARMCLMVENNPSLLYSLIYSDNENIRSRTFDLESDLEKTFLCKVLVDVRTNFKTKEAEPKNQVQLNQDNSLIGIVFNNNDYSFKPVREKELNYLNGQFYLNKLNQDKKAILEAMKKIKPNIAKDEKKHQITNSKFTDNHQILYKNNITPQKRPMDFTKKNLFEASPKKQKMETPIIKII